MYLFACSGVKCVYKCVKITGAKSLKHKAKNEHKMRKYFNTETIVIIKAQLDTHTYAHKNIRQNSQITQLSLRFDR